jgi:S1-C subfamily serine protease
VILSVAGVKVSSMGDALQIVQAHLPGQTVSIRARRQGRVHTFSVKLGSRTVNAPQ